MPSFSSINFRMIEIRTEGGVAFSRLEFLQYFCNFWNSKQKFEIPAFL